MGAIQTQLAKRRQEVIGRSMAFQARLVENVFGAMFSSSKLGVDLAEATQHGSAPLDAPPTPRAPTLGALRFLS